MNPRPSAVRRLLLAGIGLVLVSTAACINTIWKTEIRSVARPDPASTESTFVKSSVKAHLADGSTVVFRQGAWLSRQRLSGNGESFGLLQSIGVPRSVVPMDSVVGVESFEGKVQAAETFIVSVAATAVGALAAAGLAVAVFGSCPTVYADTGTGLVLEAEGFSYAIAPLMEHRDVDPLRLRPGADGVLRLELRNEALETHFINHVELLAVRHPIGARVVPDQTGNPVLLEGLVPVVGAVDRAGRDVRADLEAQDGRLFGTAESTMRTARVGDLDDWIDLELPDLPPGDSVAVLLRLRNSLLNTVLLYDGMLGGHDALDWLHTGLQHIASTVDLARWYSRTMGMHASVHGVGGEVRIPDVGPIAFRDVAIVLPRPAGGSAGSRVRLRFVADNWRIDEVRVAGIVVRPGHSVLPLDTIIVPTPLDGTGPVRDVAAVRAVAAPDDEYLETRPGQRMTLVFRADTMARATSAGTTYLLAWQGWYREWVRGSWLAAPVRDKPFVPGDEAMLTALTRWGERKADFERQFYASRIPVK